MYIEGDVPSVVTSNGGNNGNGGFGYGSDAWVLIILFALIFGWGRNGNGNGNGGGTTVYDTGSEVQRGFDTQSILNKLNGLENGLCDGFYAQNTNSLNGFASVQNALCQGFSGVNNAISNNGYETRLAVNDLGYRLQDCCCRTQNQIQSCCCDLERGIDGVNYNMAKNTCDIIRAGQDNTQRIIDFLTTDKISTLTAENATLTAQLSQNAQTNTIINSLRPVAQPAYITCSPFESAYGFGRTGSCGCGCN